MGAHYLPGYTLGPTWTGAVGNLWTSGGNWTNGAAPGTLTTAHFSSPGSGSTSIILGGNVPNMRLIFDGATTPAYTFAPGGTLTVNPGGGITITNTVTTTQTLNCAVALQGPAIFANGSTAPNQRLVINGPISAADAGLKRLSLIGGGSGQLNGAISDGAGTVAVWKGGGGSWTISGNNTYSGPTDICWGTILITSDTALGSGAGSTTVLSGASLVINPGMNIDETIQISGSGVGGQGALQRADVAPYGPTAWNGDIVVSGDAEIHNRAYNNPANPIGVWTLGGNISGGSPDTALNLRSGNSNPGFFRLTGANNTYLGRTLISGGKVILDGGDNTLPVTTTVVLDTYDRGMNVQAGVLDLNGTDQTIAGLTQVARATRPRVVNGQPATGSILTINNSGSFTYSGILQDGGGTLALAKLGAGALILTGGSSFSGGTHVGGGTLLLADADAIGTGSLDVAAGTVVFAASLPKAPKLRGAVVSGSGRIDLTNNDLVIDYSPLGPGDPGPIDELRGMIGGAYNFGDWNGAGIGSSQATANAFALGYAPASLLGITFFSGQSVDDSSLLIRYTRFGDSNLDGLVDLRDLNALAMHWQTSDYWSGGDFNYDGFIDMRDLYLLAINWQHSASAAVLAETLASMGLPNVSVPEPRWGIVAIAGMLGLAGIGKARISRRGPVPRPRPWVWRRVWDKLFSSFVSQ
jgi:autotransporter-associated beta strand protein